VTARRCPGCGEAMEQFAEPDITTEQCPQCHGVFLDKGELNVLATGMAGNIEYCSVDDEIRRDTFPARQCPRCTGQMMKKVDLLAFTDLIFDFCPECESFFLDKGEIAAMNAALRKIAHRRASEEFREYNNGFLVRVDVIGGVLLVSCAGIDQRPMPVECVRIAVFFAEPLEVSVRIFKEKWYAKLAKAFGLYPGGDVQTGNEEFDRRFVVQGDSPEGVLRVLPEALLQKMVSFAAAKPSIFTDEGTLGMFPSGFVYSEGPYEAGGLGDLVSKSEPIVASLVDLASEIGSPWSTPEKKQCEG